MIDRIIRFINNIKTENQPVRSIVLVTGKPLPKTC